MIGLPQRQTALVAKQAAEVDVLSGGRLRLGIGVGWNQVEYEALDQNFHDRGNRSEEQIALLRSLWTEDEVNFQGRWHEVTHAGINPLSVQRPIPIWIGAGSQYNLVPSDRVLRRIARLSDGWFPQFAPDATERATLAKVQEFAKEAGRAPPALVWKPVLTFLTATLNFGRNGPLLGGTWARPTSPSTLCRRDYIRLVTISTPSSNSKRQFPPRQPAELRDLDKTLVNPVFRFSKSHLDSSRGIPAWTFATATPSFGRNGPSLGGAWAGPTSLLTLATAGSGKSGGFFGRPQLDKGMSGSGCDKIASAVLSCP